MIAVILAAGQGTRLRPLTEKVPKCMVTVSGKTILHRQIEAMKQAGISHVYVAAGYLGAVVEAFVEEHFSGFATVVMNREYQSTNNMYSLYLLRDYLTQGFLLANGDVLAETSIFSDLCLHTEGSFIACQKGAWLEESMKVTVKDERITSISKKTSEESAYGNSIDIYAFDAVGANALLGIVSNTIESGELTQWTEVAIDAMMSRVQVLPLDIGPRRWVEVDNMDDLSEASILFAED